MNAALTLEPVIFPQTTEEAYLHEEPHRAVKHEFVGGTLVAMAGASEPHEIAALNAATAIVTHLRGRPCRAFKSDMRLRVQVLDQVVYYYPDVMVVCDPADTRPTYKEKPVLIIEVGSSDWGRDWIEKRAVYTTLPSLEEYVIVTPDPGRREVAIFRRRSNWEPERVAQGAFTLESIGLTLDVEALFV